MKIAVLYICTGKYVHFWKSFYESSEKHFLKNHTKHYFIFTDASSLENEYNDNVIKIHQQKLGWPYDTLMRFDMFLKAEDKLVNYDYIFFLNANMLFIEDVDEEVFPSEQENGLLLVHHPFFNWVEDPKDYPFDRNRKSLAYIPKEDGCAYYMGGFNGGNAKKYLKLINTLRHNINLDLERKVIAKWHDESHLNKYVLNRKVKALPSQYGWPEGHFLEGASEPKIIIRDKAKFGGHDFLRDSKNSIPDTNKHSSSSIFINTLKRLKTRFFKS